MKESVKDNVKMVELTIAEACRVYGGSSIEDKIMLIDDLSLVPLPQVPRRANCVILGVCLSGRAEYSLDTNDYVVEPGDIMVVNDGQVMDDYRVSPDLSGVGYFIESDFFNEIIKGVHGLSSIFLFSRTHPVFHLRQEEVNAFRSYYELIKQKIDNTNHHFRTDVVRSLLMTMLYDMSDTLWRFREDHESQSSRAEIIFTQFLTLVEKNFREVRLVGWYAKQMGISPKYLSEMVKKASKRTPNEWIDKYVVLEIRLLLKNSTMSVMQIAQKMNFPNQSFLGKYFRERVGISPRKYRISES